MNENLPKKGNYFKAAASCLLLFLGIGIAGACIPTSFFWSYCPGGAVGVRVLTIIRAYSLDHVGFFMVVTIGLTSLVSRNGIVDRRSGITVVLCALSFGVGIELLQLFVPSRHASFMSLIPNSIGVSLGVLFCFLIRKWLQRHKHES